MKTQAEAEWLEGRACRDLNALAHPHPFFDSPAKAAPALSSMALKDAKWQHRSPLDANSR